MKAILGQYHYAPHRSLWGGGGFGHQLMSEVQKVHLLRIFVQKNKHESMYGR